MKKDIASFLKVSSFILLFVVIAGYAYFRTRDIAQGAKIKVTSITDGATYTDPYLPLEGTAKNALTLTINGRIIPTNQAGAFSDGLILSDGYNIISLKAEDKVGHKVDKTYRIYYKI